MNRLIIEFSGYLYVDPADLHFTTGLDVTADVLGLSTEEIVRLLRHGEIVCSFGEAYENSTKVEFVSMDYDAEELDEDETEN